jgi:hypothetical protein
MKTSATMKRAQLKCEKNQTPTVQDLQDNPPHYFATKLQCNMECILSIHSEIEFELFIK